ncbi:hypothetical protein F1188_10910 [Roseospira marina]|uniref:Uncharacterized protein n=1 Tax=Roseospira marina TaxID=140057 RepID=A0A5M6IAY6_9PROT|nr:hypothetical protein [Roseospira marina]KAA5605406.1 hypothetical protein F1188_10910 [Roseospira marina]MBB4314603.1 hypothetical protein [Roseospira marina]MBB5088792.1 hypothetical protein [Roseospira marina]
MTAAPAPDTVPDLSAARDRLRASLPETLHRALDAYDAFAARPVPEDAKAFSAWQTGCKAVLAHIELLLKLAGRVGLDLSDAGDDDPLAALLARARAAMAEGDGTDEESEGDEDAPDD